MLLCQFFVLAGNRFWFYILKYVTKQIILRTNIFLIVVEVLAMFFSGLLRLRPEKASSRQVWAASKNNPPENNVEPVPAKSELVSCSITVYLFLVSQKHQDVFVQVEISE